MISELPLSISLTFGLTTLLTIWFLYQAARPARTSLILISCWLGLQAILSIVGFYIQPSGVPPRFPALIIPPLLLLIGLFSTRRGRQFLDGLRLRQLTLLHMVRIPVEIVLFWLALYRYVPLLMTFEGRNLDILSGLTAPIVYYFGFVKGSLSRSFLITWNLACLALLINIVLTAALSAPTPFQQFAFDQPNRAILYFPFVWLPSVVVPIVLLAHLASLYQLIRRPNVVLHQTT